jgi:hypothetical protein
MQNMYYIGLDAHKVVRGMASSTPRMEVTIRISTKRTLPRSEIFPRIRSFRSRRVRPHWGQSQHIRDSVLNETLVQSLS